MDFFKGFSVGFVLLLPLFTYAVAVNRPNVFQIAIVPELALCAMWGAGMLMLLLGTRRGYEVEVSAKGVKLKIEGISLKNATGTE